MENNLTSLSSSPSSPSTPTCTVKQEKRLTYLSVIIVTLIAFEVVAVLTAMPYVVEQLQGEHLYALASGITLAAQLITTALAGPWCDAKGPKPALYTGTVLFVIGLIIATITPNIEFLVLGRAIQGFGAGLSVVPIYMMIGHYIPVLRQPPVFAALAAAWILPSLIGPVVAGLLVEYLHWRVVFGFTAVLVVFLCPYMVGTLNQLPDIGNNGKIIGLKRVLGYAITAGLAVGSLQIISGLKNIHISFVTVLAILLLSVLTMLAIRPLLPAHTLRIARGLPATIFYRFLINGTYITAELFLPLILKEIHHFSPTRAGFVVTVGSITWAFGSWLQGKIRAEKWRVRFPFIGSALQLSGTLLTFLVFISQLPGEIVFIGWLLASIGIGLVFPAMTVHALYLTPKAQQGHTSSALSLADTLGAAIMIAYAGIIYSALLSFKQLAFIGALSFVCVIIGFSLLITPLITPK